MRADAATEAAVLRTLDVFNRAFTAKHVPSALDLFAPNPDVIFLGSEAGEMATGPTELRRTFERILARSQTYSWEWKWRVVSTAGSIAWVVADAVVHTRHDARESTSPYRMTVVLEKRGGRWLWTHYHGSEPVGG